MKGEWRITPHLTAPAALLCCVPAVGHYWGSQWKGLARQPGLTVCGMLHRLLRRLCMHTSRDSEHIQSERTEMS